MAVNGQGLERGTPRTTTSSKILQGSLSCQVPHHQDFAAKLFNNLPEALKKVQSIQMEMQKHLFLYLRPRLDLDAI